jgi:hypothetical protein
MKFSTLLDGQFDDYFAAAQTGRPLWMFVHVPKTGGSSMNGELMPVYGPSKHIFIDYYEEGRTYHELIDEAVDKFLAAAEEKRFRFCTGHLLAPQVTRIMHSLPDVRPFTMLREPVSRVLSDFRYQRSDMHPSNEAFRAQFPTLESYIDQLGEANKFAVHLLPDALRLAGDPDPCVEYLIDTFCFVGFQELFSVSLHALTWFAKKPRFSTVRRRISDPDANNEVVLTYELQESIRERNALDVAIYERLSARFFAISDALTLYLNEKAPRPEVTA